MEVYESKESTKKPNNNIVGDKLGNSQPSQMPQKAFTNDGLIRQNENKHKINESSNTDKTDITLKKLLLSRKKISGAEIHFKNIKSENYFNKLELTSILVTKDEIEKVLIIKKKYFIVKSFGEISIYSIKSNKLKFKIPLNEKKDDQYHHMIFNIGKFIFDFDYKLRLINKKQNNIYELLTDRHLIEINLNKNEWKIINELEKGIYISNLDVLLYKHPLQIYDKEGKLKKEIKRNQFFGGIFGLYEIKKKYLIINSHMEFIILDINNNYKILYSKENCYYDHGYKHPYVLDENTIIFSTLLNPYIEQSYQYIVLDLNNFSEKLIWNIYYNEGDYDSINKLFIIHRVKTNIYLQ